MPNTEITGYWFLGTPQEFEPDAKLVEFISNGPEPVFFSLGSMYTDLKQMKRLLDIFISATMQCKERAIILMPIDMENKLPDNIYQVKDIPYSWLLDKVSVVVHHCGFETTAEVLKAGLPSIPIPHIFDQFKTANKLYKSELACKPLNIHKLGVRTLSQTLSEIKNNKQIAEHTRNIGLSIRKERGLEKAVKLICKHLDS